MSVRYHKYLGELWQDLNLEDLVSALSDFLLQSGFGEEGSDWDGQGLEELEEAILEALTRRGLLSDEELDQLMSDSDALEQFLHICALHHFIGELVQTGLALEDEDGHAELHAELRIQGVLGAVMQERIHHCTVTTHVDLFHVRCADIVFKHQAQHFAHCRMRQRT